MKIAILNKLLQHQIDEMEKKPYEFWARQQFPMTREEECADGNVQFEIELLDSNEAYIQLSVSVDDGGISAYLPPSKSVVIRKS